MLVFFYEIGAALLLFLLAFLLAERLEICFGVVGALLQLQLQAYVAFPFSALNQQ